PEWTGKTVLDFGGNQGSLLVDSNGRIRPRDYYCLDVIEDAIEEGRGQFPDGHWVHYDRYNCSFNPEGARDLPIPEMGVAFDFIVAFSVFTHTTRDEMHDLVAQLRARLAPGGTLASISRPWSPRRRSHRGARDRRGVQARTDDGRKCRPPRFCVKDRTWSSPGKEGIRHGCESGWRTEAAGWRPGRH